MMGTKKDKHPSIHDVADLAGVSIASVSRALNQRGGRVSDQTRQRVIKAAEALNYSPNHIGRSLRAQSTNTYAFVLSNIQNNFYAAVVWELERMVNERGCALLLYTSNESPEMQDRCLQDIRARQVSGVFLLCAVDSPRLREIARQEPVVFINRRVPSLSGASFVGIDDRAASRELVTTALRRQPGPLALIHGPLSSDTSARRLHSMLETCEQFGVPVPPAHRREAKLSMEAGYEAAASLIEKGRFSAVFCGNDQIAYGVYRRCRDLGIRIPEELPLYGFDDNPLNEWLAGWLNTVRVPYGEFARAALEEMERLQGASAPQEVILPYQLILRS